MNSFYIPVRWRFFSVIFILSFLSYMLRQHFPVAGEFMMRELAISELQMGWVYGAFFWGYLVFQIPGGILGKRYGPRLTLLSQASFGCSPVCSLQPCLDVLRHQSRAPSRC